MSYHITKNLGKTEFSTAVDKVTAALKDEGFGILTEIDMKGTLKKKIDADIRPYQILGACNPPLAYQAVQSEEKIGLMLPCNVVVQELANGTIDVSAVNPEASMQAIQNDNLGTVASEVKIKLEKVISSL